MRDGDVTVSTSMIRVGSTMYPVHNITAVSIAKKPGQRTSGIVLAVLGLVFTLILPPLGVLMLLAGAVTALTSKDKFILHLATNGGQVAAMESTEEEKIHRTAAALGTALSYRRY